MRTGSRTWGSRGWIRGLVVTALVAGVVVGVSLGTTSAQAAHSAAALVTTPRAKVSIVGFSFSPATLTVKKGTKVTWRNNDSASHTVTSTAGAGVGATVTGLFDSGTLSPGSSFSRRFTRRGTFYYECTIHASMPSMHAKVVVK
jgi:plastocyanin